METRVGRHESMNHFSLRMLRCGKVPVALILLLMVPSLLSAGVPILLDGEPVARTNGSGVAHFSIRGAPGTEYIVELETRERPRLRPRSPTHLFTLPDADEIFVINQAFDPEKEPRRRGRRPTRITKIE